VNAIILTHDKAIHVTALRNYHDKRAEVDRKAGSNWLVTRSDCEFYIPDVYERITKTVKLTALNETNFCLISNPVDSDTGKPQYGLTIVKNGPITFFLQPGEELIGIEEKILIARNQALVVTATRGFQDSTGKNRKPGETWTVTGPCLYYAPTLFVNNSRVIKKAFLYFEPLGIYFFEPQWVFIGLALFYFLLYLVVR